jgi:hypothetical protein
MLKIASGFDLGPPPVSPPLLARCPAAAIQQEKSEWCWAACFQMLLKMLECSPIRQCAVVEKVIDSRPGECCGGGDCNVPLGVSHVIAGLSRVGLRAWTVARTLSVHELREVNAANPIVLSLFRSSVGHMILVIALDRSQLLFTVLDPLLGLGAVAHRFFMTRYPMGTWTQTWLHLR